MMQTRLAYIIHLAGSCGGQNLNPSMRRPEWKHGTLCALNDSPKHYLNGAIVSGHLDPEIVGFPLFIDLFICLIRVLLSLLVHRA